MKQEVKNSIIMVVCVLLIIVMVYFVTAFFLTGEIGSKGSNNSDESSIVGTHLSYSNVIIAGKTLSQVEKHYMVLFFSDKKAKESLKIYLKNYDNSEKEIKLYKVNLDEAINSFVKSDEKNTNATNSSELKINGTTLITIDEGKITSYIDDETQILEILK